MFRTQIKPVIKCINRWEDLKKYRDMIVAHNLRNKSQKSIFNEIEHKPKFKTPQTHDDFVLLFELLALITKNIGVEFPELLNHFSFDERILDFIEYEKIETDFFKDFSNVCDEIKSLGLKKAERTRL